MIMAFWPRHGQERMSCGSQARPMSTSTTSGNALKRWRQNMNILVLLGGDSRAFHEAGYTYPKLLAEVDGVPVIQRVIGALEPLHRRGDKAIYVVRGEDVHRYHSGRAISLLDP